MPFQDEITPGRRTVLTAALALGVAPFAGPACSGLPGLSGSYTFSLGLTVLANGRRYQSSSVFIARASYGYDFNSQEPWNVFYEGGPLIVNARESGTLLTMIGGAKYRLPYPTASQPVVYIPFLMSVANDPTIVPSRPDLPRGELLAILNKQERILGTRPLSLLLAARRLPSDTPIPENIYPPFIWLPDGSSFDGFKMFDLAHASSATNGTISKIEMTISHSTGRPSLQLPDAPWVTALQSYRAPYGVGIGDFIH